MKKILMIANFARFPWEEGNSRFNYIMNSLDCEKVEVEFITSSFFHGEKKQRNINDKRFENLNYKTTLLYEPGYKKNVSLKRFYSHNIFSKNVKKYLETIEKPDLIYATIPSLDVAKVAADYAHKNNIEFIIDIQDLWPEAFKMVFNIPIIKDIVFLPMKLQADSIYSKADYIISVSETYAQRAIKVNKKYKEKVVAFLGTDLKYFDECRKNSNLKKKENIFEVAYLGTLGNSYDIKTVIDALKIVKESGINNIQFSLFGNGPLEDEFKEYAKKQNVNCDFTGRLSYEKMIERLCNSDIAVNPLRKGAAQSIINKVGDYAAAALPVINTLENEEYKKLVEDYNIGFNIETENPKAMADKIIELYNNSELRNTLGKNNRILAEEKFNRKNSYKRIIEILENN